jgi:type IX secretion system PorP/SprF family membrane protein
MSSKITSNLFLFMLLILGRLGAQDLHYSQFYHSPLNINPGLTGVYNGDCRISANWRNQWRNVPVNYQTFTAEYDSKYYFKRSEKSFLGYGLQLNYDKAGDSKLQYLNLSLNGSYNYIINPRNIITGGLQLGYVQRSFKLDDLKWDNQFDNNIGSYVATLPNGENFSRLKFGFFDASVGANYRWQKPSKRTKIDFGLGYFHLTQPKQNFIDGKDIKLSSRLSGYVMSSFKLTNGLDLLVNALYQKQNQQDEAVGGAAVRIHLNQRPAKELAVQLGINYRANPGNSFVGDALIPTIEVHYTKWHVGLSYDINVSGFKEATNGRGGPELSMSYRCINVKPLKENKICPIF